MIWFTSDTHFNHSKIIKYCQRPFLNVKEMNEYLITYWNILIKPRDIVYHLGDFCFGPNGTRILKQLNGNVHLILGNHDFRNYKNIDGFKSISKILNINYKNINITLCHFAMRVWHKKHRGSMMLYGHSHGTLESIENSFDVGVDVNNFKPISIDYILNKRQKPKEFALEKNLTKYYVYPDVFYQLQCNDNNR